MSASLSLLLKAGERIYLNGAVISVDRKVRIEVLNDATFLLGTHILQPEQAVTPLKQLYFAVQSMLVEPGTAPSAATMAMHMLGALRMAFGRRDVLDALAAVDGDLAAGKPYPALKKLRALFAIEAAILSGADTLPEIKARENAA
jgi:flagellar biosynthesis repressor protein FlbT